MNDEEIMKIAYGNLKSEYDTKNLLWDKELRRDIKNAIYKAIEITRQDERKRILDLVLKHYEKRKKEYEEDPDVFRAGTMKALFEFAQIIKELSGERGAQVSPCGDGDASARGGGDDTFSHAEEAPQGSGSPAKTKEVSERWEDGI